MGLRRRIGIEREFDDRPSRREQRRAHVVVALPIRQRPEPGDSGALAAAASKRYRTDAVKQPQREQTTSAAIATGQNWP